MLLVEGTYQFFLVHCLWIVDLNKRCPYSVDQYFKVVSGGRMDFIFDEPLQEISKSVKSGERGGHRHVPFGLIHPTKKFLKDKIYIPNYVSEPHLIEANETLVGIGHLLLGGFLNNQ